MLMIPRKNSIIRRRSGHDDHAGDPAMMTARLRNFRLAWRLPPLSHPPERGLMARLLGIIVALGLSIPVVGSAWCAADGAAARAAIDEAERAVQAARERSALWTTAEEALAQARAALSREDYAAAVSAAQRATGQARLGLEQTGYPDFTWLIKESP
jgi:hypothetical protein